LYVYTLTMPAHYGYAHGSGRYIDACISHDFFGFKNHFGLLLGVAVFQEAVNMRYYIQIYLVWVAVCACFIALAFFPELVHALLAAAGHGLICAHDYSLNSIALV